MDPALIELEGIEKTYGKAGSPTAVLKGVSFRITAGEYVAIMGPSGAGKTTLMNIIGLLDRPTAGHHRIEGVDVVDLDDRARSRLRNGRIGFVFQQFHLLERATALQNVLLPLIYAEKYPHDAEERARRALDAVGLAARLAHRANELSGGEQQRVAIARALICDPAIILADEPTGNLDSRSATEILAIFKRLNRDRRTLIVVTHDAGVAEHALRLIAMKDGLLQVDRPVDRPRDAEAELAAAEKEPAK